MIQSRTPFLSENLLENELISLADLRTKMGKVKVIVIVIVFCVLLLLQRIGCLRITDCRNIFGTAIVYSASVAC